MKFENKVAIVTGGSKGIGYGIALRLAEEGADVVIADVDDVAAKMAVGEIEQLGRRAIAVHTDVSKPEDVANLFAEAGKLGQVSIVVNNAGIFPTKPFSEMTEADWDKTIDVNLKSVFLMSRAAVDVLPEGGRIVSVSSIASLIGFEGLTHYCASKSGINGLTRSLALELAPKQITVNAVAPGAIDTPGARASGMDEATRSAMLAAIPLKRQGSPEDIAAAVSFLASSDASYITGQVLVVDGGWTLR